MYTLRIVTYEKAFDEGKYVPNTENFELGTNYSIYMNGSKSFEGEITDMKSDYKKKVKAILVGADGLSFVIPYKDVDENRRSYYIVGHDGQTIEKI